MSEPNFINHEIVFNPTGNEFDECRGELLGSYQLVKIEDYEYKFIKQPQLTISKSIAKKIDKFIKVLHFLNEFEAINFLSAMDLNGDRTPQWLKDNPMLVFAYLAGKALGVDLVKVVEG